jgi:tRNA uridine 5-carboxymethylaminomethyl modification enzyme
MTSKHSDRDFDIVVIGGGHAGVEAALASARMGMRVGLVTMDPKRLALMSCNPAIGGIGKSQLVKEIDALGGIMGEATDASGIQFRRLNLSRGPAVWSTRVQCDRRHYNNYIVESVAKQTLITVIEGLAGDLIFESGLSSRPTVAGIRLENGTEISSGAVIVATGTFLGGLIHIGEKQTPAGRFGEKAAYKLSETFARLGFELGRLKTGTPPRLDGNTIDWSVCEEQPGERPIPFVSTRTIPHDRTQVSCYLTRTTQQTREIVLANVHRSPMFSGQISGTGPRYCPSIEDKFFRFADKPAHQLFLEPEGNGTSEIYPNGFSTSLPEDVQLAAMRTVIGLEKVEFTRPGYAVEYDYCPTNQIYPSLETRAVSALFFAGQINGTSGYEEAAGQGLIAGINAARYLQSEQAVIFDRTTSYLGVMVDDLTTRSTTEPYRMFTSRAEYRLFLREDNARDRLADLAARLGLVSKEVTRSFREIQEDTERLVALYARQRIDDTLRARLQLVSLASSVETIADLSRQPAISLPELSAALGEQKDDIHSSNDPVLRALITIRYQGYIEKQEREVAKFRKQESMTIPVTFDYQSVVGLKREALEKFRRFQPGSLGQAGRIEGITPGDVAILAVYLKRHTAGSTTSPGSLS